MSEHVEEHVESAAPEPSPEPQIEGEATASAVEPSTEIEQLQTLRDELAGARQEAAENQDRYLRARADMENYKKRIERTYSDLARTSKKDLLGKLLSVKDNLERALHYGENAESTGEGIMEGVRLTQYQLDSLLGQEGVQSIDAEGRAFDPRLDEAIQRVSDPNVPDGTVMQVVRKGYTYGDEVLRPAQVIVNVHDTDE